MAVKRDEHFFFSCFIFSAPITKDLRLLKCGIWKISHLKHKTHSDHFRNYNTWYLKAFKITEKQIFASLLYWGYLVLISVWASNLFRIFFAQKFINSSIQKCCLCGVQNVLKLVSIRNEHLIFYFLCGKNGPLMEHLFFFSSITNIFCS